MYHVTFSYQCSTPGKRFKNENDSFYLNQPVKCQENETWSLSAESLTPISNKCDCKFSMNIFWQNINHENFKGTIV